MCLPYEINWTGNMSSWANSTLWSSHINRILEVLLSIAPHFLQGGGLFRASCPLPSLLWAKLVFYLTGFFVVVVAPHFSCFPRSFLHSITGYQNIWQLLQVLKLVIFILFCSELKMNSPDEDFFQTCHSMVSKSFKMVNRQFRKVIMKWGLQTQCPLKVSATFANTMTNPIVSWHSDLLKTAIVGSPHEEQMSRIYMDNLSHPLFMWRVYKKPVYTQVPSVLLALWLCGSRYLKMLLVSLVIIGRIVRDN